MGNLIGSPWHIALGLYAAVSLVLVWRYTIQCNNLRKNALIQRGIKTPFAPFIPKILRDALFFPIDILWHGLEAWLKELES